MSLRDISKIEWPKDEEWGPRYVSRVGQKFARLTVLQEGRLARTDHSSYRYYCKCKCDCGNECVVERSHMMRGHIQSCGCLQKECLQRFLDTLKKPKGVAAFNETYGSYKRMALRRGYSFELTKDEFREIITQPCIYCGNALTQTKKSRDKEGLRVYNGGFSYTGIDRYDNTKGYTVENAVPCCKRCNQIKSDMSLQEFEERLDTILKRKHVWKKTE